MNDDRAARLEEIADQIWNLEESPLYGYRKKMGYSPVTGEGNVDAAILLIGEAPGAEEAKTGRPFVGNAGRVLDELLESIDVERKDVYITNVVKDRPPDNRDPTAGEIELYAPFLLRQIEIIQPDVIVTLGRFAMDFILEQFNLPEKKQKISDLHGKVLEAQASYGDISIVPLYHPAATFYNRDLEDALQEDFQVLKRFT
jgi:uracil-DNA glycosylase family 4